MHTNGDGSAAELTKREVFAALALQGLLASDNAVWDDGNVVPQSASEMAAAALRLADALIAALNAPKKQEE